MLVEEDRSAAFFDAMDKAGMVDFMEVKKCKEGNEVFDYELISKVLGCVEVSVGLQHITARKMLNPSGTPYYIFNKPLEEMISVLDQGGVIVLLFTEVIGKEGDKNVERLTKVCVFHAGTGGTGADNVLAQLKILAKRGMCKEKLGIYPDGNRSAITNILKPHICDTSQAGAMGICVALNTIAQLFNEGLDVSGPGGMRRTPVCADLSRQCSGTHALEERSKVMLREAVEAAGGTLEDYVEGHHEIDIIIAYSSDDPDPVTVQHKSCSTLPQPGKVFTIALRHPGRAPLQPGAVDALLLHIVFLREVWVFPTVKQTDGGETVPFLDEMVNGEPLWKKQAFVLTSNRRAAWEPFRLTYGDDIKEVAKRLREMLLEVRSSNRALTDPELYETHKFITDAERKERNKRAREKRSAASAALKLLAQATRHGSA